MMIDANATITLTGKNGLIKFQALSRIRTHDLCITSVSLSPFVSCISAPSRVVEAIASPSTSAVPDKLNAGDNLAMV